MDFVSNQIGKNSISIGKSVKQKNGIDLYLSSNKFLKQIGKKLKNTFSGELIESKSLFTVNRITSKKVYRGCILFRFHAIKKREIISIRGDQYEVLKISNNIYVKNLKTGKKKYVKFQDLA